ncbi:MAG: hypothetical protein J7J46_05550 [Candidatus Desulfofervidus sp.]|nr:hypothetical protein [Candidatus Desulfofervidus sp.]
MDFLNQVEEFTKGCRDVTTSLKLDGSGNVVSPAPLTLNDTAVSQLCSFVGCTVKFFDILKEEGLCEVINKVLKGTQFLLRLRERTVRGVLSTSYKPIDNIVVSQELLPHLKLSKVLGKVSDPVWEMLTDEFSIMRIEGVQRREMDVTFVPSLMITNSEVGKAALNLRLAVQTREFRIVSDPIVRKIHIGPYAGVLVEEDLVRAFKGLVKSLPQVDLSREIQFRPIDFGLLHYPSDVMRVIFGMTKSELTEMQSASFPLRSLVKSTLSPKLTVHWRYILARDFFDLLLRFNYYVHDGWVIRWPHHVR